MQGAHGPGATSDEHGSRLAEGQTPTLPALCVLGGGLVVQHPSGQPVFAFSDIIAIERDNCACLKVKVVVPKQS